MKPDYFTIESEAEYVLTVEKSRFIARAYPVETSAAALEILKKLRKEFYDASHICSAFVMGADGNKQKFSDAGEPQGTAGLPIIECIKRKNLKNVLLAVVRYFGGKKLGAGGLARAYSAAASGALNACTVAEMRYCSYISVTVPFSEGCKILDFPVKSKTYIDGVTTVYAVPLNEKAAFTAAVSATYSGAAVIVDEGEGYWRVNKL